MYDFFATVETRAAATDPVAEELVVETAAFLDNVISLKLTTSSGRPVHR